LRRKYNKTAVFYKKTPSLCERNLKQKNFFSQKILMVLIAFSFSVYKAEEHAKLFENPN
jgi:hypothetical protein